MTSARPAITSPLGLPPADDEPEDNGINGATMPPAAADEIRLVELAAMSPLAYDRIRQAEADKLGCRVSTLDAIVEKRRPKQASDADADPFGWYVEPASEPVDGGELLNDLVAEFAERVILPPHGGEAMALWTLHAWTHDAADISPLLVFTSPEKRCGKTRALIALGRVVPKRLPASNISPAAMYRAVEEWRPTLLIDEADSFMRENEELRGIVNSGHSRELAVVVRADKNADDVNKPAHFSTWCPKAIGVIDKLADTLVDRAIILSMRRKRVDEQVIGRRPDDRPRTLALRQRCARWAADNLERLRYRSAPLPAGLNDRAADNWTHLLAIAELAGGGWPARTRVAALALSGSEVETDSIKAELLADIRAIFAELAEQHTKPEEKDRIKSADLASRLGNMAEKPWAEWKAGKPITQRQLARQLAPFGIASGTVWFGTTSAKGYMLDAFADAFARYLLPSSGAIRSVRPSEATASAALGPNSIRQDGGGLTDRKSSETGGLPSFCRTDGSKEGGSGEGMPEPPGLPDRIDGDPDGDPDGDDSDELPL